MDYETYNKSASHLSWLLTPATVCLAVPLYKQLHLLRKHGDAVLAGIASGVVTSAVSIFLMCRFLKMSHVHYVTLLQIHNNSHWNGSEPGGGRNCDIDCAEHLHHRRHWKYGR